MLEWLTEGSGIEWIPLETYMTARAPGVLKNVVSTYRTGGIAISPGARHRHVTI